MCLATAAELPWSFDECRQTIKRKQNPCSAKEFYPEFTSDSVPTLFFWVKQKGSSAVVERKWYEVLGLEVRTCQSPDALLLFDQQAASSPRVSAVTTSARGRGVSHILLKAQTSPWCAHCAEYQPLVLSTTAPASRAERTAGLLNVSSSVHGGRDGTLSSQRPKLRCEMLCRSQSGQSERGSYSSTSQPRFFNK